MCSAFSSLQNMNMNKVKPEVMETMIKKGREHLEFCIKLYEIQHEQGLYFLHEHPAQASSWNLPGVLKVLSLPGVSKVTSPMCAFGMMSKEAHWVHVECQTITR